MRRFPVAVILTALLMGLVSGGVAATLETNMPIRLMTYEPAHFHAALFQREMVPGVAAVVDVYSTAGPDLAAHLGRIEAFNHRKENPTRWQLQVHTNGHPLEQMLAEKPGNVVVVSGRNRGKIQCLHAMVKGGLNVLADKPWIIEPEDLPLLEQTLDSADERGVIAYDAMTQRFEVSCQVPRELIHDPAIFGELVKGTGENPAVELESIHYLLKEVAGAPLLRPAWYFDIHQQGEALADVGTHLVDLVQWTLYPGQAIDYHQDITLLSASRWPTYLNLAQFQHVTGETRFPEFLQDSIHEGTLECFANNTVTYHLRDTHVKLTLKWGFQAPEGSKDSEHAIFRGTKSRIEVRQGAKENFKAEVYVVPNEPSELPRIESALRMKVAKLQSTYPGIEVIRSGAELEILIPETLRIGHEAHFALVARHFLDYVLHPKSLPAWEKPNMLAKYYVTTQGVKLARATSLQPK